MKHNKHIFAFFTKTLEFSSGEASLIKEKALISRIKTVIRVKEKEQLILFNETHHASGTVEIKNKKMYFTPHTVLKNTPLSPSITLYQAVTKKQAFEDIVYSAAALGVQRIVPVITKKSNHKWLNEKSYERFSSIAVAACEQAKQFVIPTLSNEIKLNNIALKNTKALLLDPAGEKLTAILAQKHEDIAIFIGPEGGFVQEEIDFICSAGASSFCLTPSILRSIEAATVSLGILRSLL